MSCIKADGDLGSQSTSHLFEFLTRSETLQTVLTACIPREDLRDLKRQIRRPPMNFSFKKNKDGLQEVLIFTIGRDERPMPNGATIFITSKNFLNLQDGNKRRKSRLAFFTYSEENMARHFVKDRFIPERDSVRIRIVPIS